MSITEINTSNRSTTTNTPNNSSVTMTASRSTTVTPNRQAAINGLAVVGFVALIAASMWLAVYSTRYVPSVVGRLGTAAVYLGSVFTPADEPTLSVVPTQTASSTIISFGETTPTTDADTTSKPTTPAKQVAPTAGQKTTNTYQINGTTATGALSGLPDLTVTINAVGYLTSTSTESFVASTTVPSGGTAAVNFTIKNIGTNVTGLWCFTATIPTQSSYIYESRSQDTRPLAPGDYIDYTLGFNQANRGAQTTSVTANSITARCTQAIAESNTNNNNASEKIIISY